MKKLLLFFCLSLFSLAAYTQPYPLPGWSETQKTKKEEKTDKNQALSKVNEYLVEKGLDKATDLTEGLDAMLAYTFDKHNEMEQDVINIIYGYESESGSFTPGAVVALGAVVNNKGTNNEDAALLEALVWVGFATSVKDNRYTFIVLASAAKILGLNPYNVKLSDVKERTKLVELRAITARPQLIEAGVKNYIIKR